MRSVQAVRWARTRSCSRSPNLAPYSNSSESPLSTSRSDPREDSKRSPLLDSVVPFETEKGHWTQEGCEGPYGIRGRTVLHPSVYVDFQPLGLTWGEERYRLPFVSTLCPSTKIGPSKPVFQRTSGSPDQAYLQPHYADVDNRPVYGPSAFDFPKEIWRGIIVAPADDS